MQRLGFYSGSSCSGFKLISDQFLYMLGGSILVSIDSSSHGIGYNRTSPVGELAARQHNPISSHTKLHSNFHQGLSKLAPNMLSPASQPDRQPRRTPPKHPIHEPVHVNGRPVRARILGSPVSSTKSNHDRQHVDRLTSIHLPLRLQPTPAIRMESESGRGQSNQRYVGPEPSSTRSNRLFERRQGLHHPQRSRNRSVWVRVSRQDFGSC